MGGSSGGGGGGGNQTTTSTTKVELPGYAVPYAEKLLTQGDALAQQPYTPYPGQKISGLTPEHEAGLQAITNRSVYGTPEISAARQNMTDTLQGQYMEPGSNPYLSGAMDRAASSITDKYMKATAPGLSAAASRAGAYGGSAYGEAVKDNQSALMEGLEGAANSTLYNNYGQERLAQQRAQTLAPQYSGLDYTDARNLMAVGDIRRGYGQDILNQNLSNFNESQQYPYRQLDVLSNAIRGSVAGQSTTTQAAASPYQPSATSGAIGGGLLGYGAAQQYGGNSAFGQNPLLGAGAGALLGGLAL